MRAPCPAATRSPASGRSRWTRGGHAAGRRPERRQGGAARLVGHREGGGLVRRGGQRDGRTALAAEAEVVPADVQGIAFLKAGPLHRSPVDPGPLAAQEVDHPGPPRQSQEGAVVPREAPVVDPKATGGRPAHQGHDTSNPPLRGDPTPAVGLQEGLRGAVVRPRRRPCSQRVGRMVRRRRSFPGGVVAGQPDQIGPDADRLARPQPPRGGGHPAPRDAGSALQVDAEDLPGQDLQVGVTLADLLVIEARSRPRTPPDQRERLRG